jgi:hypothetical protein
MTEVDLVHTHLSHGYVEDCPACRQVLRDISAAKAAKAA